MMAKTAPRLTVGAVVTILALGATCSAVASPTPAEKLVGIHRIAVIAALGDQVAMAKTGLTVFTNKASDLDIRDWGLDAVAIDEAKRDLAGRFTVEDVTYEKASFTRPAGFFANPFHQLQNTIRALPRSDVDAYLALVKGELDLPYPSNQKVEGLLVEQTWMSKKIFHGTPEMYAAYWVLLVDAKTGKTIDWQRAEISSDRLAEMTAAELGSPPPALHARRRYVDAIAPVAAADWSDTAELMTDQQRQGLRSGFEMLIRGSVDDTLADLGLANAPVGAQPQDHSAALQSGTR